MEFSKHENVPVQLCPISATQIHPHQPPIDTIKRSTNLQRVLLAIDLNVFVHELHANCMEIVLLVAIGHESIHKAALAYASIAQDDHLQEDGLVRWSHVRHVVARNTVAAAAVLIKFKQSATVASVARVVFFLLFFLFSARANWI